MLCESYRFALLYCWGSAHQDSNHAFWKAIRMPLRGEGEVELYDRPTLFYCCAICFDRMLLSCTENGTLV